jgi:hypothetical protein
MSEPGPEQIKTAEPVYLTAVQVADLLQVDQKTVLYGSLQDPSMPVDRLLVRPERHEPHGARIRARAAQAVHGV